MTILATDLAFLRKHAGPLAHSGRSLLDHLEGTSALLDAWRLPSHVCRAGLFHSVYGTEAFDDIALSDRTAVARQVGDRTESLVHLFCTLDRDSLFENASRTGGYRATKRDGGEVALDETTLVELFHIAAANWVEQRGRLEPAHQRARAGTYFRIAERLCPAARHMVRAEIDATLESASSLTKLFAFDDATAVDATCATLDVSYLTFISQYLAAGLDTALRARIDALPDNELIALLRSPETCFYALTELESLPGYVEAAVQVAEVRAGLRDSVDRDAWSAACDLFIPVAGERYTAPVVGGWVTADFASPGACRQLEQISYKSLPFGPQQPLTPEERECVLTKLTGSLAGIAQTNPIVTRFLRYSLTTIIPRKQTNPNLYPSNSFKGSSTAATIHRANIYNLYNANVNTAHLAQSIIHESVHNHLYKRELFEATLVDVDAGEAVLVTSPWSGNTLDLYVFAHSSTVYYALHSFFKHPRVGEALPAQTAAHYRQRAVAGFTSDAWAAIVREHGHLFAPSVRRDLAAMRDVVAGEP